MKKGIVLGAALAIAAIGTGAFLAMRARGPVDDGLRPFVARSEDPASDRVILAMRTMHGVEASFEAIRAADGTTVWRTPLRDLDSSYALAVGDGLVVGLKMDRIFALDRETGAPKWETKVAGPSELPKLFALNEVWIHDGIVVARRGLLDTTTLVGFDAKDGKKLWESPPVDGLNAPVFVGKFALIPVEHTTAPSLLVVGLHDGSMKKTGAGLGWPGHARGDAYVAALSGANEALVSIDALSNPDAAIAAAKSTPKIDLDGAWATGILSVDPATLATKRIGRARAACARASFVGMVGDRYLCDEDDAKTLVLHPLGNGATLRLKAPEGYRFWGGGASDRLDSKRNTLPFVDPAARFVPVVLNHKREDTAKVCVLDLDSLTFHWCAARDIPPDGRSPYGWIDIQSRGPLHMIGIPGSGDPMLFVDGTTGAALSAIALKGLQGTNLGRHWADDQWAGAGMVLVGLTRDVAWAVDARAGKLLWTRGEGPLTVVDAKAEAERALGSLPVAAKAEAPHDAGTPGCIVVDAEDLAGDLVTLEGKVTTVRHSHPNGSSFEAYVLTLPSPRAVCGLDETTSVQEIQLAPMDSDKELRAAVGKRVRITGSAFPEHTAWHIRPVLVQVTKTEPL